MRTAGAPAPGPLAAHLSLERRRYPASEPIFLHYEVRNTSQEPLRIWLSGFWRNHRVVVTGPSGREAPLTAAGEERRLAFSPGGARDKNAPLWLAPQERYIGFSPIDLTQLYRLAPGSYRVRVIHEEAQGMQVRVASNEVHFAVAP